MSDKYKQADVGSAGAFGALTASFFQATRIEVVIDRPANEVWDILTDLSYATLKLWNPSIVSVEHISGERGRENEFVLVTKDSVQTRGQAPFYMRTIRMVPNQLRVLRCDAVDGSYATFVDHSLYELDGGKTRLVYNLYLERCRVSAEEAKAFNFAGAAEDTMGSLKHSHGILKNVLEQKASAE